MLVEPFCEGPKRTQQTPTGGTVEIEFRRTEECGWQLSHNPKPLKERSPICINDDFVFHCVCVLAEDFRFAMDAIRIQNKPTAMQESKP